MKIMESTLLIGIRSIVNGWRVSLFLGVLFILSGTLALGFPMVNNELLDTGFGILILISGIFEINFALVHRSKIRGWKWIFAGGLLDFFIGIILMYNHVIPFITLSYYVAFWLLFRSIMSIGVSFEQQSPNIFGWEWLLIYVVVNIAFAFTILTNIVFDGIETLNTIAISCLVFGFYRIVMAIGLKQMIHSGIPNH